MVFECAFCPFRTKMRGLLKQHAFYKHTESGEINWIQCEHCSYKAKTSVHMKQHLTNKHTDERQIEWYHCSECSYKAKTKGTMKQHQLNKHTDTEQIQWVTCVECSYKTKTNGAMKQHFMKKHGGNEANMAMVKCPECSYKTRTERTMEQHIVKKHSGIEVACEQCTYRTKTNARLKQHVKTKHAGDCKKCSYANGEAKAPPWIPPESSAFFTNFNVSADPKPELRRSGETSEASHKPAASSGAAEDAKHSRLTDTNNLFRPSAVDVQSRFEETKQILRSAMESTMNPALGSAHEHFNFGHLHQGFYESIWTNRL